MQRNNNFITLIEELNSLACKEQEAKFYEFTSFIAELSQLYEQEQQSQYNEYIKPFIAQHPFLTSPSTLQVIKKHKYENYHSLFLKHIWSDEYIGAKALSALIKQVDEDIFSQIISQDYTVEAEHPIKNARKRSLNRKRIDLLIESKDWVIVIENKIMSSVSQDTIRKRSQLQSYRLYCEDHLSQYKKTYILLSHTDNREDAINDGWEYADYYQVFKSLLDFSDNDIVRDYLKTLYALLFDDNPMPKDISTSLYRINQFTQKIIAKI